MINHIWRHDGALQGIHGAHFLASKWQLRALHFQWETAATLVRFNTNNAGEKLAVLAGAVSAGRTPLVQQSQCCSCQQQRKPGLGSAATQEIAPRRFRFELALRQWHPARFPQWSQRIL